MDTIKLEMEDGQMVEFCVLEQTQLMNVNYYMVVEKEEQDKADADSEYETECYILKENGQDDEYAMYEFVEDEKELEALYPIFSELLEESDVDVTR